MLTATHDRVDGSVARIRRSGDRLERSAISQRHRLDGERCGMNDRLGAELLRLARAGAPVSARVAS